MNKYEFAQRYIDVFLGGCIIGALITGFMLMTQLIFPNPITLFGVYLFISQSIIMGILFGVCNTLLPKDDEELERFRREGKINKQ